MSWDTFIAAILAPLMKDGGPIEEDFLSPAENLKLKAWPGWYASEQGSIDETRRALQADPRLASGGLARAFDAEVARMDNELIAREAEAEATGGSDDER